MSERLELRLDVNTRAILEKLCEKYNLSKSDILRKLVLLGSENRLLESNWKELLIEDTLKLFEDKERIRLKSEIMMFDLREGSKEKDRQLQRQLTLMNAFLKTRTDSERREFFDRELRIGEPASFPSPIEDGYEVYINGKRVIVKELLKDGFPKMLKGYESNQERLVRCDKGFHTKGSWCEMCNSITTCPIIRDERLEGMSR